MEEAEQTQDAPTPPSPLAIEPSTGSKRRSATEHDPTPDAPKEKKPTYENQLMNSIDLSIEQKKLGEPECKQLTQV